MAAALTIEEITTPEGFASLEASWDALAASMPDATPFHFHGWYRCCVDREPGRRLRILAIRDGAAMVGIVPLWSFPHRLRGVTIRALGWISSVESGVCDLLVAPARREDVVAGVVAHLAAARGGAWDLLLLSQWPDASPQFQAFDSALGRRRARRLIGTSSLVPFIPVAGPWEEFWSTRSYLFRKSRRGILNRMERVPGVEVSRVREGRGGETLRELFAVSEKGWKHREGVSLAATEASRRFFSDLTALAARRGWLDLWFCRVPDGPIAFEYGLHYGGVIHALRSEFDEAYSKQSPGALLEYQIVRTAFEEGQREYSGGPGLDSYKTRWTEHVRRHVTLSWFAGTPMGTAAWWIEAKLVPWLRRLRRAERANAANGSSEEGSKP